MIDAVLESAGWIALGCAIGAALAMAWMGWRAWRDWQRLQLVRRAAVALIDVHARRVDDSIAEADAAVGALADGGEQLAESLGQLRDDVGQLRWLLAQVPHERARLTRTIGDLLLPTDDRPKRADDER